MKKKVGMFGSIVFAMVIGIGGYINQEVNPLSDLFLVNVEALALDEYYGKVAEKTITTRDSGPLYDDEGKIFHYITTLIDCNGVGVIECESSISVSVSYDENV